MGQLLRSAAAVAVLIAGLAFHVRNHGLLTLDFYLVSVTVPVSWVVVGALSLGAAAGALAMLPGRWTLQRALKRQRRQLSLLREAEPGGTGVAKTNGP